MTWRRSDKVALGFFIAALVAFVGFQVLPYGVFVTAHSTATSTPKYAEDMEVIEWESLWGWEVWSDIYYGITNPSELTQNSGLLISAVVLGGFLTVSSPFFVRMWSLNRLLWVGALVCSAGTAASIAWLIKDLVRAWTRGEEFFMIGPGFLCLVTFPVFHLVGVLSIRKRRVELSGE